MTEQVEQSTQLWTLKEVAARLRVSERTMHNLLNSQQIEGKLTANRWKFSEQAIHDYLERATPKEGKGAKGAKKKRAYHRKKQPGEA